MIKKHLLFIIIAVIFLSCQKEISKTKSKIDEIEFSYQSGLRIPFNKVHINISRFSTDSAIVFINTEPLFNNPKWSYSKIDKIVKIDIKLFERFTREAVLLDSINIDKAHTIGNDGSTWKLEFGSKGKNRSYSFWSPYSSTKRRGLSKFVSLCEEIVDISKLEKKEILGDK